MSARVADLADAVMNDINGQAWSQTFAAERGYLPRFKFNELTTLRVLVVPKSEVESVASRSTTQREFGIDVGVLKKLDTDDNPEMDALVALTDELKEHMRGKRFSSPQALWRGTAHEPIYDPTQLQENKTFFSVITFNFLMFN